MFLMMFIIASCIFITNNVEKNIFAQETNQLSVAKRIKLLETQLNLQKKLYKVIGENSISPNGKIVKKITSTESFEIFALPMLEPADMGKYQQPFVGKLFSESGYKLSETSSNYGIKVSTSIPDTSSPKIHKFEFINPNTLPLKVRFYYVQSAKN